MHGGKDDKKAKGNREAIVMNPPLKEAGELPKKVITKGHEIAKSLIKHRAKVKNAYAVGMATAKKSAGIKEEAELEEALTHNMDAGELRQHLAKKYGHIEHGHFVHPNTRETYMYHVKRLAKMIGKHPDHVRKQVKKDYKHASDMGEGVQNESVYPERHAAAKKIIGDVAKKKGGKVNFQSTSFKDGKKVTVHGYHDEKGERHVTHTTTEEVQIDELSKETMKSYIKAVDKRKEGVKRGTGVNTASQKIAKQEPSKTLHKTISSLDKRPHSRLKSSDVFKYGAAHRELKRRGEIKTS